MKSLKAILGIALSIGGLGTTAAVAGVSMAAENNTTSFVEAANETKTLYFDFSNNSKFQESGCNPHFRYWDGTNDGDIACSVESGYVYKATGVPIACLNNASTGFELYCWGQGKTNNDCTTYWTQNTSLQYSTYNYLRLNSYTKNQQNSIQGYGYYNAKIDNPGPTASTQRVWLKNDTPYFYGDGCVNGLGYFDSSSNYKVIPMVRHINHNSNDYYYADIPASTTSVHFLRLSSDYKIYYLDAYVETLVYGKCYYSGTANYDDFVNISAGTVSSADAYLLKAVVEAFLTCSTAASNGSNATTVANLKSTWFDGKAADGTNGSISELTLSDYANGDTSYAGSKSKTVTVKDKWEAMLAKAGVSGTNVIHPIDNSSFASPVIIIVGVLSISSLAVFFILRKKKFER